MKHLSRAEIQAYAENAAWARGAQEHLAECADCARQSAGARQLERALAGLERVEPQGDLTARILARLPQDAPLTLPVWLAPLTVLVALASSALAFRTAFDLRANGAFDLLATYTSQPQIVTAYPSAAWDALTAAIPWATLTASVIALGVALALVYRLAGGLTLTARTR